MLPKEEYILNDVKRALSEDIGTGDVTAALIPKDLKIKAMIISREPMFVAGMPWVDNVFKEIDPSIRLEWLVDEGSWLNSPSTLCNITGVARNILTAERTALNFLQTISATATETYKYIQVIKNYNTKLLDTRKTLPGLRLAQKYAVFAAGGVNHRFGLYDAFLIKENHIKSCGSITKAIKAARDLNKDLFLEVEVENLEELNEALKSKPHRILLDNFSLEMISKAVLINNPKFCDLEVSGGVSLANIESIAKTGVDYISVGAITKSIKAIDLSLLIEDIV